MPSDVSRELRSSCSAMSQPETIVKARMFLTGFRDNQVAMAARPYSTAGNKQKGKHAVASGVTVPSDSQLSWAGEKHVRKRRGENVVILDCWEASDTVPNKSSWKHRESFEWGEKQNFLENRRQKVRIRGTTRIGWTPGVESLKEVFSDQFCSWYLLLISSSQRNPNGNFSMMIPTPTGWWRKHLTLRPWPDEGL